MFSFACGFGGGFSRKDSLSRKLAELGLSLRLLEQVRPDGLENSELLILP